MEEIDMVKVGLFVRLVAADGREDDLAEFLTGAQSLVEDEPGTRVWYAIRFDSRTFGIFDAFDDDEGRDAHLNGAVAQGLGDNADLFAEDPSIEKVDVLASK
jgi:quinol monooxygenase YgiN